MILHAPSTETAVCALFSLHTCSLGIRENSAGQIEEILFMPPQTQINAPKTVTAQLFIAQIEQYLADPQHSISLPLSPRGSAFQHRVWHAIRSIPPGRTRQYGELARELNSAARAIGQACGANPFPLITPCHRIMAKTGLGGFAHAQNGWLLDTKRWLLRHEGAL